jgi:multicomponent Na+:H+ antiporter subunit E
MQGCPVSALPEAGTTRALVVRALLYFVLWIVVDQSARPANLAVGLLASAAATWASLKLLPPASGRVRLGLLLLLLPRFLWQSLVAGTDVARRAFSPRLRLQPGFVDYPVGLPRGPARNAFELIASLMPGSLPSGETEDTIQFHCLDTRQPVLEQLAAEERAYARALQPGSRDG